MWVHTQSDIGAYGIDMVAYMIEMDAELEKSQRNVVCMCEGGAMSAEASGKGREWRADVSGGPARTSNLAFLRVKGTMQI